MATDRAKYLANLIIEGAESGITSGDISPMVRKAREILSGVKKAARTSFASILGAEPVKKSAADPGFATPTGNGPKTSAAVTAPSFGLVGRDPWLYPTGENFAESEESGIVTAANFVAPKPGDLGQAPASALTDVFKAESASAVQLIDAANRLEHVGDHAGAAAIRKKLGDKGREADWSGQIHGTPRDRERLRTWREGQA